MWINKSKREIVEEFFKYYISYIVHLNRFLDNVCLIDFKAFQIFRLTGGHDFNSSNFLHVCQIHWQ